MAIRWLAKSRAGGRLLEAMDQLNARHPWSHNDHFHSWTLAHLPDRRRKALDVGCGRGELLAVLAPHFSEVLGTDIDEAMRRQASFRCAGLTNVTVSGDSLGALSGAFDLVTMVAVLHHLDPADALRKVRRLLSPGGHFLAVGLAPAQSLRDHAWDLLSFLTNPVIGYVKHPWPSRGGLLSPPVPVRDATVPFEALRDLVREVMPGARVRHQLGFRHTIAWTKQA